MADIELVIKIPNEIYQDIVKNRFLYDEDSEVVSHAIINGTLLPKGHGRLKDVDALEVSTGSIDDWSVEDFVYLDEIEDAPTIIEADKEE